jgi:hypothetical protein
MKLIAIPGIAHSFYGTVNIHQEVPGFSTGLKPEFQLYLADGK